jgi:DNA-binding MarR family transcriptional regulator
MKIHKRPVGTIYLLKRAELAVRSCMEVALAQFGLTPAQFLMLFRLSDNPGLSSAALARDIGLRPQSIVGLVHPLEQAGYLERETSPQHQRVLHVHLTAKGRKLVGDAMRVAGRVEAELLEELTVQQVEALQEALAIIWRRSEAHELHPGSIRAKAKQLVTSGLAGANRRGARLAASNPTAPGRRPRAR